MVDPVTSPTQSIQDINAAYLAQYGTTKKANEAASSGGFAKELEKIERQELPAPIQLASSAKTNITAPKSSASAASNQVASKDSDDCLDVKIARSGRMACAEQATHLSYEDDDFGFEDFVDFINPLHHIPVLGTLYREITGDTIKPEVQVAGSIVMGAITGNILVSAIAGIASAVIEQESGKEPLVQVADALWGDKVQVGDGAAPSKVAMASGDASGTLVASAETTDGAAEASKAAARAIKVAENTPVAAPVEDVQTAELREQLKYQQTAELAATTVSTGAPRVGNVIYTSPMLKSAAKVASAVPVQAAQTAQTAQTTQTASVAKTKLDNTTLGTLIHEQAKARDAGQQLPPELVHDMMLMAMDKYKGAHVASADMAATTAIQ